MGFDRDWDEIDLDDEVLDLDSTGVGDLISNLAKPHEVDDEGFGTYDSDARIINERLDAIDEDEQVERILTELGLDEYENYTPPFRDEEDAFADGEVDDDDGPMAPQQVPDKGYEDYR